MLKKGSVSPTEKNNDVRSRRHIARRRQMLALVIGLLLVLGVLSFWQARSRRAGTRAPFERFLAEFIAPAQQMAGAVRNAATPDPDYPLTPVGLERLRAAEEENRLLRKLLQLRDTTAATAFVAEVIARETNPWAGYLTLDKGSVDGVEPRMAVLTPDGVLGQITEVNLHTAKVLLLTDGASGIGAVTPRGKAFGVVKGDTHGRCRVAYVPGTADVLPGDTVVTSGESQVFIKGLRLGTVDDVKPDTAQSARIVIMRPAANPATAKHVLLVKYQLPNGVE